MYTAASILHLRDPTGGFLHDNNSGSALVCPAAVPQRCACFHSYKFSRVLRIVALTVGRLSFQHFWFLLHHKDHIIITTTVMFLLSSSSTIFKIMLTKLIALVLYFSTSCQHSVPIHTSWAVMHPTKQCHSFSSYSPQQGHLVSH
ncbi:hypothetical protein QL285_053732 [Trifolium repens]|nr:hypothetical protein QL285_053732 [Trifolium repens]